MEATTNSEEVNASKQRCRNCRRLLTGQSIAVLWCSGEIKEHTPFLLASPEDRNFIGNLSEFIIASIITCVIEISRLGLFEFGPHVACEGGSRVDQSRLQALASKQWSSINWLDKPTKQNQNKKRNTTTDIILNILKKIKKLNKNEKTSARRAPKVPCMAPQTPAHRNGKWTVGSRLGSPV
ncbi:hypothetical protein KQX54_001650 [Cotesia glomerata]|uniref:Uncharacterized protein n=1 Tax=Cotesia glomerata TaxID=32391 RepID=A0AAV7IXR0_COTGL|nr:hypothetical protein KQX54_001650 [Cotesia glomerata]